jgi:acyl carrier protein
MSKIHDQVIDTIYQVCRPDRPDLSDPKRPLLSSGLDSLDFASLMMALEDRFSIIVKEEDLSQMASVDAIVKYVETHANA